VPGGSGGVPGSQQIINLTGTGVTAATAVTVTPTSLSYSSQAVGTTSPAQSVAITNTGTEVLNITNITTGTSGDFSQTNTCLSQPYNGSLSVGQSCTISVAFNPTASGTRAASLSITDNATGSPQTVTLTGSGPNFSISASPSTLTVVHGSAGTSTITLTPQAKFAQTVAVSCAGAPANSTCTLSPPNVQLFGGAAETTTLTLPTTASTAPGTYTLTVTGTYAPLSNSTTITLTVQ